MDAACSATRSAHAAPGLGGGPSRLCFLLGPLSGRQGGQGGLTPPSRISLSVASTTRSQSGPGWCPAQECPGGWVTLELHRLPVGGHDGLSGCWEAGGPASLGRVAILLPLQGVGG